MNKSLFNILEINSNPDTSIFSIFLSILIGYILSFLLGKIFIKEAKTISNRRSLASVFPLLTVTTTIVIAVVKSSLALSLGLVGALSIVRFRTPIKEPEELTYLFLAIAIGLACGANQYSIAIFGFLLSFIGILFQNKYSKKNSYKNSLRLLVKGISNKDLNTLVKIISKYSKRVDLNNIIIAEDKSNISITCSILVNSFKEIDGLNNEISEVFPKATFSIIDSDNFY